ncbi:MAG: ABC transporter ATP-binding protein [Bacteroidetes bacterium]|nr:MAG: ABC transporter ATP-binding protein [Bacteroidota bacterium]
MTNALEIKGLSKEYKLGKGKSFFALKEIDLSLEKGKVLGLIGHNGAGKSTLLKILSRITYPSSGEIDVYGKLSSLLEVGTGFHPELSGRENIYLNGSILGMTKSEIKERFADIVAFAGVEEFLDLPVKRYSSGMYVRLAFAVAAHLDAEVLLIDEVLAVGDAEFQKRCLQRMDSLSKEKERSIVFVSHNMSAIVKLCDEVAWLEKGQIIARGAPQEIIDQYLAKTAELNRDIPVHLRDDREGDGRAKIVDISIAKNKIGQFFTSGSRLNLAVKFELSNAKAQNFKLELHLFNSRGNYLSTFSHSANLTGLKQESWLCEVKDLNLMPGDFFFNAHLYLDGQRADFVGRAFYFKVIDEKSEDNEIAISRQNPGIYLLNTWTTLKP